MSLNNPILYFSLIGTSLKTSRLVEFLPHPLITSLSGKHSNYTASVSTHFYVVFAENAVQPREYINTHKNLFMKFVSAMLRGSERPLHHDELRTVVPEPANEEAGAGFERGGVVPAVRVPRTLAARRPLLAPHHHFGQAGMGQGGVGQEELRV